MKDVNTTLVYCSVYYTFLNPIACLHWVYKFPLSAVHFPEDTASQKHLLVAKPPLSFHSHAMALGSTPSLIRWKQAQHPHFSPRAYIYGVIIFLYDNLTRLNSLNLLGYLQGQAEPCHIALVAITKWNSCSRILPLCKWNQKPQIQAFSIIKAWINSKLIYTRAWD